MKEKKYTDKKKEPRFWDTPTLIMFAITMIVLGGGPGYALGRASKETYWREKLVRDGRAHYVFDETTGKGKWEYTYFYHFWLCPTGAHSQEEGMRFYNNSIHLLK